MMKQSPDTKHTVGGALECSEFRALCSGCSCSEDIDTKGTALDAVPGRKKPSGSYSARRASFSRACSIIRSLRAVNVLESSISFFFMYVFISCSSKWKRSERIQRTKKENKKRDAG